MRGGGVLGLGILLACVEVGMPVAVAAAGPALPLSARIRSEINLMLNLHNYLMSGATTAADRYKTEVEQYRRARQMGASRAVWQLVNDACVAAPDAASIRRLSEGLPGSLTIPDREAAGLVLGALASAWTRFEPQDLADHRRALQSVMADVFRGQFGARIEPALMGSLYEKMGFLPLDAPLTAYPVLDAVEMGAWGKTSAGYYLVIPVARRHPMMIIESLVHEATHIIDSNQPAGSRSVLSRLRQAAGGAGEAEREAFLHGLVVFNAGEMLKRSVPGGFQPQSETSPKLQGQLKPFLPAYRGVWLPYLDGRMTLEEAVQKLATRAGGEDAG